MCFHQPFLNRVAEELPDADVLLGKPLPVRSAALFYETLRGPFDPARSLQWLIDTPGRMAGYLELARGLGTKLRISVEIDVGLHRGGVTTTEALDAILRANDCGYREKGNVLYVYTKKELEEIDKAERKQVTETFRVYYTPAANAVNMLKPVLSPEAQVAFSTAPTTGIESGAKDIGGNSQANATASASPTQAVREQPSSGARGAPAR